MSDVIKFEDNILVQVVSDPNKGYVKYSSNQKILPSNFKDKIKDTIEPILDTVSKSIVDVFNKVDETVEIPSAEVTLNLGFETGGNVFICQGKLNSNISVKLTIKQKK